MLKKFNQFINEQKSLKDLTQEQVIFLSEYTTRTWNLNERTGLIDVTGDFRVPERYNDIKLTDLKGIKFGKITGSFYASGNNLTTLEGAPQEVGGNFYVTGNKLTSLIGGPKKVGKGYSCRMNQLKSLEGAPISVGGGPMSVGGGFNCDNNLLTDLIGCPETIGGDFSARSNNLVSLKGKSKSIDGYEDFGNNTFVELVLEASLKSPQIYLKAVERTFRENKVDLKKWPIIDLGWISIF